MNYFDLIIAAILLITALSGFKNGLIQSVFKTVGYIAGGVIGVAIAVEVMSKWSNTLAKAGGAIILILLLATAGEFILGKIGLGFRKSLLIAPPAFASVLLHLLITSTAIATPTTPPVIYPTVLKILWSNPFLNPLNAVISSIAAIIKSK